MKIVVLLGGASPERKISIISAKGISRALHELGHELICFDPATNKSFEYNEEEIEKLLDIEYIPEAKSESVEYLFSSLLEIKHKVKPDIIFNALHGGYGEDGLIQDLMDRLKLKFTGSKSLACRLAMNKSVSKKIMRDMNILTANWQVVKKSEYLNNGFNLKLSLPVIVKPNNGGSSVALSKVERLEVLDVAIKLALEIDDEVMIEEFIHGREITVAILGESAHSIVEIKPKKELYDYECKYTKGMSEYLVPAPIDAGLTDEIKKIALRCFQAMELSVYGRVDFLLDKGNQVYCLEANTLPGMTETSLVPKSLTCDGISFNQLIEEIIELSKNN
jgi:D-alanine-D-alanine ligase